MDAEGPLVRLKNLLLNKETLQTVQQWVIENWYICVLIGIGFLIFMGIFIKCCAVHTPSSNPKKPPARRISDTLRRPMNTLRRMVNSKSSFQTKKCIENINFSATMATQTLLEAYPHPNSAVTALEVAIISSQLNIPLVAPDLINSLPKNLVVAHSSRHDLQITGTDIIEDKITREVCYLSQCDLEVTKGLPNYSISNHH